ncbi:MAG: NUMOD4 domain-containing protein, partial [Ignavibacteria bacterium]|nr:NUMOD4 domain-containing protein [Ignavibacteria bacterium]
MEIWKDIELFEGKYQVSNTGKVKSIDRIDVNGRKRIGIELKYLIESQGYPRVTLWINRHEKKDIRIHFLVASAFILNPENKKTVNHIDGNKQNNDVSNLEWNTYSENHLHAYR